MSPALTVSSHDCNRFLSLWTGLWCWQRPAGCRRKATALCAHPPVCTLVCFQQAGARCNARCILRHLKSSNHTERNDSLSSSEASLATNSWEAGFSSGQLLLLLTARFRHHLLQAFVHPRLERVRFLEGPSQRSSCCHVSARQSREQQLPSNRSGCDALQLGCILAKHHAFNPCNGIEAKTCPRACKANKTSFAKLRPSGHTAPHSHMGVGIGMRAIALKWQARHRLLLALGDHPCTRDTPARITHVISIP